MSTKLDSPLGNLGFQRPANEEARLNALSENRQKYYMEWRKGAAAVAEKRKDVDPKTFTNFLDGLLDVQAKDQQILEKKYAEAKQKNIAVSARGFHKESEHRVNSYISKYWNDKVKSPNEKQAFNELMNEVRGESIFSAAFKQLYDKDKGGLQLGGIAGLIGGGLLANTLIPGGIFGGGLLSFGVIAGIATAFAGSWLGNKTTGMISNALSGDKKSDSGLETQTPPAPTTPEKEQAASKDIDEDTKRAVYEAQLKRLGVPQEASGTTPPVQPTPTAAPAGQSEKKPAGGATPTGRR